MYRLRDKFYRYDATTYVHVMYQTYIETMWQLIL